MDVSFGPNERLRLSNDLSSITETVEGVGERDRAGLFRLLPRATLR